MGDLIREEHALALLEAPGGDGPFNPDGTVNVVLIRPCDGRGPGGRIYTREVLEAAAPAFTGWPSYLNHLDPAAARKAAMRRGPDELAGEIREASWDPAYTGPDDGRYGYEPGAVVGRFMPATDLVEQLLRRIPGNSSCRSRLRRRRFGAGPGRTARRGGWSRGSRTIPRTRASIL